MADRSYDRCNINTRQRIVCPRILELRYNEIQSKELCSYQGPDPLTPDKLCATIDFISSCIRHLRGGQLRLAKTRTQPCTFIRLEGSNTFHDIGDFQRILKTSKHGN